MRRGACIVGLYHGCKPIIMPCSPMWLCRVGHPQYSCSCNGLRISWSVASELPLRNRNHVTLLIPRGKEKLCTHRQLWGLCRDSNDFRNTSFIECVLRGHLGWCINKLWWSRVGGCWSYEYLSVAASVPIDAGGVCRCSGRLPELLLRTESVNTIDKFHDW